MFAIFLMVWTFGCDRSDETDSDLLTTPTVTETSYTGTTTTSTTTSTTTTTTTTTTTPSDRGFGFNHLHTFPDGFGQTPLDIEALPNGQLLILTLEGKFYLFDTTTDTMVGEHHAGSAEANDDFLSMTAHHQFGDGKNDYVYVYRTNTVEIERYQVFFEPFVMSAAELVFKAKGGDKIDPSSSGGDLVWWDGEVGEPVLYMTTGLDGATISKDPKSQDKKNYCQNEMWTTCSVLAFQEAEDGTLVPGVLDTPYANPVIVAKGLRQPWRMAHCGDGLCIADLAGDDPLTEDLNIYTGSGQNFGNGLDKKKKGALKVTDPVLTYDHEDTSFMEEDLDHSGPLSFMKASWVSQAIFSENVFAPELVGKLVWGDFYDGWLRVLDPWEDPEPSTEHLAHLRYVSSMVEAPDGQVYALAMTGALKRLVYRDLVDQVGEPGTPLSETSFYSEAIDYEVRYPLWSNGSAKIRKLQLPKDSLIDNTGSSWEFPVGTHLWKTFEWGGEPVETRLIERRESGWVAGTFIYEEDGEAYLSDGYNNQLKTESGEYTVPSMVSCFECHAATAGDIVPLGIEPFQLDDPGLDLLRPYLMVDPGLAPQIKSSDELNQSVRGTLHANCAYCHNPDGRATQLGWIEFDLSFDTPLEAAHVLDRPTKYYIPSSPIISPGVSSESAIVSVVADGFMPPLGVWQPDMTLVGDLNQWIDQMNK